MSFVTPHGEMWLFANIPLDDKYENVYRFPKSWTRSTIADWFTNRGIWDGEMTAHFTDLSYQRVDNQTFKVNAPAWEHYTDNYIVFRNHGIGEDGQYYGLNDYYFGFITDVLYINDNCTQFTYKIDWMTTWFNNCKFDDCFIERCTPDSDQVGDNIVPENFGELGDYTHQNRRDVYAYDNTVWDCFIDENTHTKIRSRGHSIAQYKVSSLSQLETFIMVCDIDESGFPFTLNGVDGSMLENTYSGATIYFSLSNYSDDPDPYADTICNCIDSFLAKYILHPDSIINIYRAPAYIAAGLVASGIAEAIDTPNMYKIGKWDNVGAFMFEYVWGDTEVSSGTANFGYYYPVNKKLYTYPYTYLSVDNGCGDHMDLRYEFFSHSHNEVAYTPQFYIEMSMIPPVQVRIIPYGYGYNMRVSDAESYTFHEQLVLEQYPTCSWNNDYFIAWLAQNSVPIAAESVGSALNGLSGDITGGLSNINNSTNLIPYGLNGVQSNNDSISISSGAISAATSLFTKTYKAAIHADSYSGNLSAGNLSNAQMESNFHIQRMNITEEMAKSIDDYFSMFGYAQKKVMNIKDIVYGNGVNYCYIKGTGVQCSGDPSPGNGDTSGVPTQARNAIEQIMEKGTRFWNYSYPNRIGDVLNQRSGNNAPCTMS